MAEGDVHLKEVTLLERNEGLNPKKSAESTQAEDTTQELGLTTAISDSNISGEPGSNTRIRTTELNTSTLATPRDKTLTSNDKPSVAEPLVTDDEMIEVGNEVDCLPSPACVPDPYQRCVNRLLDPLYQTPQKDWFEGTVLQNTVAFAGKIRASGRWAKTKKQCNSTKGQGGEVTKSRTKDKTVFSNSEQGTLTKSVLEDRNIDRLVKNKGKKRSGTQSVCNTQTKRKVSKSALQKKKIGTKSTQAFQKATASELLNTDNKQRSQNRSNSAGLLKPRSNAGRVKPDQAVVASQSSKSNLNKPARNRKTRKISGVTAKTVNKSTLAESVGETVRLMSNVASLVADAQQIQTRPDKPIDYSLKCSVIQNTATEPAPELANFSQIDNRSRTDFETKTSSTDTNVTEVRQPTATSPEVTATMMTGETLQDENLAGNTTTKSQTQVCSDISGDSGNIIPSSVDNAHVDINKVTIIKQSARATHVAQSHRKSIEISSLPSTGKLQVSPKDSIMIYRRDKNLKVTFSEDCEVEEDDCDESPEAVAGVAKHSETESSDVSEDIFDTSFKMKKHTPVRKAEQRPVIETSYISPEPNPPADSDHFSDIAQQLSSLNQDSALLTTPIHRKRTPKKKYRRLDSRKMTSKSRTPVKTSIKRRPFVTTPSKTLTVGKINTPKKSTVRRKLHKPSPNNDQYNETNQSQTKPSSPPAHEKEAVQGSDDLDDGSSDKLLIFEVESDEGIDKVLEEKSSKIKLTRRNVRSLLHEVITNEHVLDMVRNTMQEDGLENQLKEAIFEPKMTRSKVKEVLKSVDIPQPWPLSPMKGLQTKADTSPPNFLDLSFPEEDDDEEYRPSLEDLERQSDDESIVSSQASILGSPAPRTPQTPGTLTIVSEEDTTPSRSKPDDLQMTRMINLEPPGRSLLGTRRNIVNTFDKMCYSDAELQQKDAEIIAARTRSKMPLIDTSLEEIESNFVAPDITPDMYDSQGGDSEWQEFLSSLNKGPATAPVEVGEDDPNDPEYNFLKEAQDEEIDLEDLRTDRGVQVSKKELSELMDELFEAYREASMSLEDEASQDTDWISVSQPKVQESKKQKEKPGEHTAPDNEVTRGLDQDNVQPESNQGGMAGDADGEAEAIDLTVGAATSSYPVHVPPLRIDSAFMNVMMTDIVRASDCENDDPDTEVEVLQKSDGSIVITENQKIQLQDQMRKHVQLLAQTYVQAIWTKDLAQTAHGAHMTLVELKMFRDQMQIPGVVSAFHTPNLEAAIELASVERNLDMNDPDNVDLKQCMTKFKVMNSYVYDMQCMHYQQMELMVTSDVFLFPQMLPEIRFHYPPRWVRRTTFTDAEINLIALGLYQFGHLPHKFYFIQKYLLPCRPVKQIRIRWKNYRFIKEPNAIKSMVEDKNLPEFPRYTTLEDESTIVPPEKRDPELLPIWWPVFSKVQAKFQRIQSIVGKTTNWRDLLRKEWDEPEVSSESQSKVKYSIQHSSTIKTSLTSSFTSVASDVTGSTVLRTIPGNGVPSYGAVKPTCSTCTGATPRFQPKKNFQVVTAKQLQKNSVEGSDIVKEPDKETDGKSLDREPMIMFTPSQLKQLGIDVFTSGTSTQLTCKKQSPTALKPGNSTESHDLPASSSMQNVNPIHATDSATCIDITESVTPLHGNLTPGCLNPRGGQDGSFLSLLQDSEPPGKRVSHSEVQSTDLPQDNDLPMDTPTKAVVDIMAKFAEEIPQTLDSPQEFTDNTDNSPAVGKNVNWIGEAFSSVTGVPIGDLKSPRRVSRVLNYDEATRECVPDSEKPLAPDEVDKAKKDLFKSDKSTKREESAVPVQQNEINSSSNTEIPLPHSRHSIRVPQKEIKNCKVKKIPSSESENEDENVLKPNVSQNAVVEKQTLTIEGVEPFDENSQQAIQPAESNNETFQPFFPDTTSLCSPVKPLTNESPAKSALEIVAQLAEMIPSPPRTYHKRGTITPTRGPKKWQVTPRRRDLRPAPYTRSASPSPTKRKPLRQISPKPTAGLPVQTFPNLQISRPKKSPRRKFFQRQARAILPKGFVIAPMQVSPVKKVVGNITSRAKKIRKKSPSLAFLLPRETSCSLQSSDSDVAMETSVGNMDFPKKRPFSESVESENDSDDNVAENIVDGEDGITVDKSPDSLKQPTKRKRRLSITSKGSVEAESQSEPDDDFLGDDSPEEAEDKEEHDLAELLEASSTIRFAPKRHLSESKQTKAKQKQEVMLEMLATDLIESDPQRDERDTALAQSYLHKVQDTLANDPEKYVRFRQLLAEFETSDKTPVQLYQDIEALFEDHPELVSDFSGFLLPDQALECSCLANNLEFTKARVFLRKLEVLLRKQPSQLQRVLKVFAQWQNSPTKDVRQLKDAVQPLLKGNHHLLEEFSLFFPDEQPPESHLTDFEEIYFADSEGEDEKVDDFEEVILRENGGEDLFGTSQCRCFCHNSKDQMYLHRKKHCTSCSVKIIKGKIYLQSDKHLRPAKVVFLEPTLQNEAGDHGDTADEDSDKEDNSNGRTSLQFLQNKEKSEKVKQKTQLWKGQKSFRSSSGLGSFNPAEYTTEQDRGMSKRGSRSPFTYTDESAVATPESYSEDTQMADANSDNEPIGPTDFSSLRLEINKGQEQLETQNGRTREHPNEPNVDGCDTTKTEDNESHSNLRGFAIVDGPDRDETLVNNSAGGTLSYTGISSEVVDKPFDSSKLSEPVTCDAENESDQVKDKRDTDVSTKFDQNKISVSKSVATPSVIVEQHVETSVDVNTAQGDRETGIAQSESRGSDEVAVPLSWTREEDKLILETCKRDGTVPETFTKIAETLKICNAQEAQGRFLTLMQMFMDENSDTTETETEQED